MCGKYKNYKWKKEIFALMGMEVISLFFLRNNQGKEEGRGSWGGKIAHLAKTREQQNWIAARRAAP